MNLQEFIADVIANNPSFTDEQVLTEVQNETVTKGQMISRNTMNSVLGQADIYSAIKKVAKTEGHPAQSNFDAFLDSKDYNFIVGNVTGDAQIAALDNIIAGNITVDMGGQTVNISGVLGVLKSTILNIANSTEPAYPSATIEDVKRVRGVNYLEVTSSNGFIKIAPTNNPPKHKVHYFADIQGVRTRVGSVYIDGNKEVLAGVPNHSTTFFVEDFYNMMGA